VDDKGKLIGIVSEGDLLHRAEAGTEKQRPWWLRSFVGPAKSAKATVSANLGGRLRRQSVTDAWHAVGLQIKANASHRRICGSSWLDSWLDDDFAKPRVLVI
jgi:hypothetical protein